MADEQETNEEVVDEKIEQVSDEVNEEPLSEEQEEKERPEKNYKAEIARKDAELQRLRALASTRVEQPKVKDPNDISTYSDFELKAIVHSNDPTVVRFKSAAEDELMDRRAVKILEKREAESKKVIVDLKLRNEYPEALDPTSDLALKMEDVMQEYDLSKSPAGRLAAAKIAASELKRGSSGVSAKERKAEADRVARVKGQMVDGDRSKSAESKNNPKKLEALREQVNSKSISESASAMTEILNRRGMSSDKFFKR